MSKANIQPRSLDYLPEPIPHEHFGDSFYAKVTETYWASWQEPKAQDMPRLVDAAFVVVDELGNEELLALAHLIRDDFPEFDSESDSGSGIEVIWPDQPKDLTVDEEGLVRGIVGHISAVKDYIMEIKPYMYDNEQYHELNEHLATKVYEAAYKYRGEEFALFVDDMIYREQDRRLGPGWGAD